MKMPPHLARLDAHHLDVRYRASDAPQTVTVRVDGTPKATWQPDYHVRMSDVLAMLAAGLGGGARFVPESVAVKSLAGPLAGRSPGKGPTFEWKLQVSAVEPEFLVVLVHGMANVWNVANERIFGNGFDAAALPQKVTIHGELAPDDSELSADTARVLGWLAKPEVACRAYPQMPFPVTEKPAKARTARVKLDSGPVTKKVERLLFDRVAALSFFFGALPGGPALAELTPGKKGLTLAWKDFAVKHARGPILNLLRRVHVDLLPTTAVELQLP
jgi:hypothetical protein